MRPFYRQHSNDHPTALPAKGNTGLWFTRFYDAFESDWLVGDEGKRGWLNKISGPRGDPEAIEAAAQRMHDLGKALGAVQDDFKTDWHFATGLGLSHPVENGFTWHHTLGVPYLPASGVKGLLRAWTETWCDLEDTERTVRVHRWFGASKGDADKAGDLEEGIGSLLFFDALPTGIVTLRCDIMNPHMGKWYEKGADIRGENDYADMAPADWHAPVPVPFLVVSNATFRFTIAPRLTGADSADAQARQDCKTAMAELSQALEWMGAGAKTAAGYGRMRREGAQLATDLAESGIELASGLVWKDARATWDKGKQALTVIYDGERASMSGAEAREVFNQLSDGARKRLEGGKKPLPVDATIDKTGNLNKLLGLKERPLG